MQVGLFELQFWKLHTNLFHYCIFVPIF